MKCLKATLSHLQVLSLLYYLRCINEQPSSTMNRADRVEWLELHGMRCHSLTEDCSMLLTE